MAKGLWWSSIQCECVLYCQGNDSINVLPRAFENWPSFFVLMTCPHPLVYNVENKTKNKKKHLLMSSYLLVLWPLCPGLGL